LVYTSQHRQTKVIFIYNIRAFHYFTSTITYLISFHNYFTTVDEIDKQIKENSVVMLTVQEDANMQIDKQ